MALYLQVQQNLTVALGRPPTSNEWAAALNMHPSALRGSIEASSAVKARLVSRFSPLVRAVVLKYRGRGVPTRDLLQEGACGLIQAAERFDPSHGTQFSTYAVPWIRKHVGRCLQTHGRMIRLPQRAHEQSVKMGRARAVLTEQLGRAPTLEEVAASCKLKVKVAALYDTANSDMLSLDGATAVRIGGVLAGAAKHTIGDKVLCPGARPEDAAALTELRSELHEVLSVLRPLERHVLSLRFGLAPAADTASAWMAGSHKWAGRAHSYEEVIAVLAGDYPELVAKKDVVKVERRAFHQLQQPSAIAKIEQLRHAMYPQNPPEYSYRVGGDEWS
jgi:RNA polymerase sigma factor (sigma-70 family)